MNITPNEWRNSFETDKKEKKFYLWQNFQFPDHAFKMIIPVNPDNIMNAVFGLVEIKGKIAIIKLLNSWKEEIQRSINKKGNPVVANILEGVFNQIDKFLKKDNQNMVIPERFKKAIKSYLLG